MGCRRSFQFRRISRLPRLAWCARFSRRSKFVVVEHGPWVETNPTFFVEGAWDGPFDEGGISRATAVLGSGGCIKKDGIVFCTTSHTMERLQSVTIGDDFFISNSFAYLLAATGDSTDTNYRFYERDFMTFLRGRSKATRTIRTAAKRKVRLYYGETVHVDENLDVRLEPFPPIPEFTSYDDYVSVVDSLVAALYDNASSTSRSIRYEPLSTISSGYDSPACTVFAGKIGCDRAITFLEARSDYNASQSIPSDLSDSGAQIAGYLKVQVEAFRRDDWLTRTDFPEAEFLATGNGGDDAVFASAERRLVGKLIFTGFLGDTLWGLDSSEAELSRSADYAYKFPAGGTLCEFRIRVGFIHLPIPLLALTRHAEMHRVSHSDEMRPWRLNVGHYDRPVPRRLVETSGVPRAIYAQEKKAITEPFWLPSDPQAIRTMMSPRSHDSLTAYATGIVASGLSVASRIRIKCAPRMASIAPRLNWYGFRLHETFRIRLLPKLRTDQFRISVLFSTLAGLKFHWAVDKTIARYRVTGYGAGSTRSRSRESKEAAA